MSKDCELRSTSPPAGVEPIVIIPAPRTLPCDRPAHFLTLSNLVAHRATCPYAYRKCCILLRRFRVWDEIACDFRAARGALQLRWFQTDRQQGYSLLRVHYSC